MSLLPNDIDISQDIRRQSTQNIEGVERDSVENTISIKRDEPSGQSNREDDGENSLQALIIKDCSSRLMPFTPNNVTDLCPEIFQIILMKILMSSNWRKLMPLRLVCKYWRLNVDAYLATRHGFRYTGRIENGIRPRMNYMEFNAMTSFYPNMKQLIVNDFIVGHQLVAIMRNNVPTLEKLNLKGTQGLCWRSFTILSIRFPQLKFIDVTNCEIDENCLSILVENLQNLEVLNAINPGREVSGQCLSKLGANIKDIWIGLCHLVNCNSALKALTSGNGRNILHLGLIVNNFDTTDWSIITENMPQLRSLKLTFGSSKTSSLKEFAKLKNLEFLVLAEDSRNEKQSVLTDDSLFPVLRGCSKLKSLAIAGTKDHTLRITNHTILQTLRLCPLIEQIRLLKAHHIDDDCLIQLGRFPSLAVLHLSSMKAITDVGINAIAKEAKRIRNFRVSDCPNVTEAVIDSWVEAASKRPEQRIKLFFEDMVITKDLEEYDLPSNLTMNFKVKKVENPVPAI